MKVERKEKISRKLTAKEKGDIIKAITDDILNDKEFIYESMDYAINYCRGDKALTFITMMMKRFKSEGATDEMLKQCYEIAIRSDKDGIEYMTSKLGSLIEDFINEMKNEENKD